MFWSSFWVEFGMGNSLGLIWGGSCDCANPLNSLYFSLMFITCRFIFSISCELHGWLPNCSLKHCYGDCCIFHVKIFDTSFQVYPKCYTRSHNYISCDQPDWFWCSIFDMEDWQIWFCCLHGSILWCSFCFCWDWPLDCSKNYDTRQLKSLYYYIWLPGLIKLCFHCAMEGFDILCQDSLTNYQAPDRNSWKSTKDSCIQKHSTISWSS